MTRLLILLLLCAPAMAAEDKVYRYVDADGVVHYTDKPPSKDAQPAQLPKLQRITPDTLPATTATPKAAPTRFQVSITSPAPEQTFRDHSQTLNVSASVQPALPSGYSLIYYLNGEPQPSLGGLSAQFGPIYRGSHTVVAALMGPNGKEVARSAAVTVHVKPPVVRN